MKSYNHFTLTERESLSKYLKAGKSLREIAKALEKNVSSVSRELRRNGNKDGSYHQWRATSLYIHRRKKSVRKYRYLTDTELISFTQECLDKFWSPELITVMWKRKHPYDKLSHSTIYRAIKNRILKGYSERTHLRRHGNRKHKCSNSQTIKPNHLIVDWPDEIKNRTEIGHWEGDTVRGALNKGGLVTMVDRKTRMLSARIVKTKEQQETKFAMMKSLKGLPVNSISLDNGAEFAAFREIERKLNIKIYFANPHSPWQRPTNENTNGLLRFFFPKGFDFTAIKQKDVDYVVDLINTRPRKCLDYLSPADLFSKCCT